MTRINNSLNIVVDAVDANNQPILAYSASIDYDLFKSYSMLLAKTHAALMADGLSFRQQPMIAKFALESSGDAKGFLSEIRRLTTLSLMVGSDRKSVILQSAIDNGMVSSETLDYIESMLVFFIVIRFLTQPQERTAWIELVGQLWSTTTTLQSLTDYLGSWAKLAASDDTKAMD